MSLLYVNFLAVIAASVLAMIIGSLWYSTLLFGKKWMELKNYSPDDVKNAPRAMLLAALNNLVIAFVLALVFRGMNVITVSDGLAVSFILWAGFQVTSEANDLIFGEKAFMLCVLDAAHQLTSMLGMGIVLVLLR